MNQDRTPRMILGSERYGYGIAVALSQRIAAHVRNHEVLISSCGSLHLTSLGLHEVTVRIRPWAIPQHPADELLQRLVVGSIHVANVPYRSLTQERADEIYDKVCSIFDKIKHVTDTVTALCAEATSTEYAFLRRVLAPIVMTGLSQVSHSALAEDFADCEPVTDFAFATKSGAIVEVCCGRDRLAKTLLKRTSKEPTPEETPT